MTEGSCLICKIVTLIVIIGALNWGLIALNGTDLVAQMLGPATTGSRAVYGLIGVAGVLKLLNIFGLMRCPACKKS